VTTDPPMAASLVVGVPRALTQLPPSSSVGRIWRNLLERLEAPGVRLVVTDGERRAWRLVRRVDVWMHDGHQGPLDVAAPVVSHLLEATWADPELRPLFEPAFLETYEGPSESAARAAAAVMTISESSKAQIVSAYGILPSVVHVAHPGVDHRTYRPDAGSAADLIASAGGDAERPYVLFVSVVHPRKNLASLREAMAGLAAQGYPHALVLVAGPAADRADSGELSRAAVRPIPGSAAPVVNLAGIDDADVARLMAGASAFCLPSLMEGFGMPVAEAMACGAPVVVSNRGALPEVVADAGVVVAPDAESVLAGLLRVLSDDADRDELRRRGVRRAASFSWDAAATVTLETLRSVA